MIVSPHPLRSWRTPCAATLLVLGLGCTLAQADRNSALAQGAEFRLLVSPDRLQIPAGSTASLRVVALRSGSCPEAIALSMPGLPPGITATGTIAQGEARGTLELKVAPEVAPVDLGNLEVLGRTPVLRLQGRSTLLEEKVLLSLAVLKPLPPPEASPDRSQAGGGRQTAGALSNQSVVQEPIQALRSTDASGAIEARHGFLPTFRNGSR